MIGKRPMTGDPSRHDAGSPWQGGAPRPAPTAHPPTMGVTPGRMALLFGVSLVSASGNTALQSVLAPMGTKLGIADVWVSVAFSWSALLWVMMAPYWARMSDRRGRRALMMLGTAGFCASMGLCGAALLAGQKGWLSAAATFALFALFRSLYGLLGSAAPPAVQAYVAARTPAIRRTQAMAILGSSFGLGTVIGPALAPLFVTPWLGLTGPLFAFAAGAFLLMLALWWGLPNDAPQYAARGPVISYPGGGMASPVRHDDGEATAPRARWHYGPWRNWLLAGLVGGQVQAMQFGMVAFLIMDRLHLRAHPEQAAGPIGTVLTAGALASLLGQWGVIPLLALSARMNVIVGMAVAAVGCVLLGFAHSLHAMMLAVALAALGFSLFRPGFTAGASLAAARGEQGMVAGWVASINGAAYIFAPAIGVLLYQWHSAAAIAVMGVLCILTAVWAAQQLVDAATP